MENKNLKVCYVVHPSRPNYEKEILKKAFPNIVFIDTEDAKYNSDDNVIRLTTDQNKILNKLFHSSASIYYYRNLKKVLKDFDIIFTLEVFSSTSRQVSELIHANQKHIVIVYELIKHHPIYYIPHFVYNTFKTMKQRPYYWCISHKAKMHLENKKYFQEDKAFVIYPGVDTSHFFPTQRIPKGKKLIFLGRFDRHKGVDILIESIPSLVKEGYSITFVGKGEYEKDIKLLAAEYPEQVINLGFVERNSLPQILQQHHISILPCRDSYKFNFIKIGSEQYAFSLIESMACGLAIVTSKIGVISEVVPSVNSFINNEDNSLVDQINYLFSSRLDIAKKTNSAHIIKYHSLEKNAQSLYKYVSQI